MIKNQKQVGITNARLAELKKAKQIFEEQHKDKTTAKYRLGINSMNSLIEELEGDLKEYEGLVNNDIHFLPSTSIDKIHNVLIAARLAQNMSQKDLGDLLGIKEQQIQRYEITNYETAALPRVIEISKALKLNLKIGETIIMNPNYEEEFDYPENISIEQVKEASNKIKHNGLLNV